MDPEILATWLFDEYHMKGRNISFRTKEIAKRFDLTPHQAGYYLNLLKIDCVVKRSARYPPRWRTCFTEGVGLVECDGFDTRELPYFCDEVVGDWRFGDDDKFGVFGEFIVFADSLADADFFLGDEG